MSSEHKFTSTTALPLDVSWKLLKKRGQLQLKFMPQFFAKIENLEGDGGTGTILVVTLGEGVGPQAVGKQIKERVDVWDDATHTLIYSIVEGGDPRYTDVKNTLKLTAAGDSTSTEWTINYTLESSDVPPPDKRMESFAESLAKAMERYAKENPSEFA